jgi:RNA polymerase sigma-70 factor (ECF subfamily)
MTETDIIKQLRSGSIEALKEIMEIHQDYVLTLAYRFVRNRELAEEITQDVFLKVYNKIHTFQSNSRFSTWLYTIVYRTSLNYLERKSVTVSRISLEEELSELVDTNNKSVEGNTGELQIILWKAIDQLPIIQGVVILLYYLNQFSISEIAEIIKSPPNTIKTHLHRGRKQLKTILLNNYSMEELL